MTSNEPVRTAWDLHGSTVHQKTYKDATGARTGLARGPQMIPNDPEDLPRDARCTPNDSQRPSKGTKGHPMTSEMSQAARTHPKRMPTSHL